MRAGAPARVIREKEGGRIRRGNKRVEERAEEQRREKG